MLVQSATVTGLDGIRDERDRFVAFAFAVADAFIQVDTKQLIRYAGGATRWLTGRDGESLRNSSLLDCVVRKDRPLLRAALATARDQGRCGPITVHFIAASEQPLAVAVFGTHLPSNGADVFLAIRALALDAGSQIHSEIDVDSETRLLKTEPFQRLAGRALAAPTGLGQSYTMTLLSLEGMAALRGRLGAEQAKDFIDDLTAHLKVSSVGGASAGRLEEEKFGLVHASNLDVAALQKTIEQHGRDADPKGRGFVTRSVTIDLQTVGMSETEAAKALVYAINKFSEAKGDFTIGELADVYKEMLTETQYKIEHFKEVISTGGFDPLFQPIVHLHNRRIHHYEALARLRASGQQASPASFIGFAEEVGIIPDFDLAMCRKVIEKLDTAKTYGHRLKLAVNLSSRSLGNPSFMEELHALLRRYPDITEALLFEVTESWKIDDLDSVNGALQSLRRAGHMVCLDDFGAGSAAFQYLRAFEVDIVKIDGAYVHDAMSKANGVAFIRSIAKLCHDLGIRTVGEMVETEEMAELLRECGVDMGQGYLFGRPSAGLLPQRDRFVS